MSRRLIIVDDEADNDPAALKRALDLLQEGGFKAYPVSSVFAAGSVLIENADLSGAPQADQAALQTLLLQKTLLEDELRRLSYLDRKFR